MSAGSESRALQLWEPKVMRGFFMLFTFFVLDADARIRISPSLQQLLDVNGPPLNQQLRQEVPRPRHEGHSQLVKHLRFLRNNHTYTTRGSG
jgi:hypothetical protein